MKHRRGHTAGRQQRVATVSNGKLMLELGSGHATTQRQVGVKPFTD
jgi:hypothetical protein